MENPRPEKVAIVTEVKERLTSSQSVVVTEYRGLSVKALADLRRSLRPVGGAYKVYKNTLVRRAANEAGIDIDDQLVGPTALTFTETTPDGAPGDIVGVAKALKDFARTHPQLIIKGGLLEGGPVDADSINRLADLESREVLLARFAGLMAAPMQQMAALLQAVPSNFAYGLQALIDSRGGADAAPVAETAAGADDHPAAEASIDEAPMDEAPVDEAPVAEDAPAPDGDDAADAAPAEEAVDQTETNEEDGED
ncbi:MAG: 50S ribosomal protein L10 [Acidimicrobiales bacterium]